MGLKILDIYVTSYTFNAIKKGHKTALRIDFNTHAADRLIGMRYDVINVYNSFIGYAERNSFAPRFCEKAAPDYSNILTFPYNGYEIKDEGWGKGSGAVFVVKLDVE